MGLQQEHITHREHASAGSTSSSEIMTESKVHEVIPYAEHGAPIDHVGPQEEVVQAQPDLAWSRIRHTLREPLAEFFGTISFCRHRHVC